MKKIALLLVVTMLLNLMPVSVMAAPEDGPSWDLIDSTMEDYTENWKVSKGNLAGAVTQMEGYVNILKTDEETVNPSNGGAYTWLVLQNGVDLPEDQPFTAEVTLRMSGETTGKTGEISARLGQNSNDTNGKLYPVYVQYGKDGWVASNADGTGAVTLDTTVWHNYGMVVNHAAQTYSVYVDGKQVIAEAGAVTYKGADLFRIGVDNDARCNMDVKAACLGIGDLSALLTAADPYSDVLFMDDFEDGNSDNWAVDSGSWLETDGAYVQSNSSGAAMAFAGDTNWQDYSVEVTMTPTATSKNVAIMLSGRADGANNRYIGAYNGGKLMIDRRIDGSSTILAQIGYTMEVGKTYTMMLSFSGEDITLSVNGVKELEAADAAHTSGKIGLATYNTSAVFDNVIVRPVSASADTLSVNGFANYQVFQRDTVNKNAVLPVTGTVTRDGAAAVEARVMEFDASAEDEAVVDWTSLAVNEGAYDGQLTVPQGGWYRIEVRALDEKSEVLEQLTDDHKWGVGINILCIGQSNMVGQGAAPYMEANDLVANYRSGRWQHLVDPYDNAGASLVPAMGNYLVEALGLPVGIIPAADSGSGLHAPNIGHAETRYWMYYDETNPGNTSTLYGRALARAQAAGGVECMVWNQGETDGRLMIAEEVYEQDMKTLLQRFRTDLGNAEIPMFLCQIGTHDTNISDDASYTEIRNAQHDLDDGKNFFLAATEMEFERKDTAHYTTPGLNEIGRRVAHSILYYYGETDYYRGPYIESADYADESRSIIDVKIAHRGGTDLVTSGEITGFTVLDNLAETEILSAVRYDSNTIRLTLGAPVSGNGRVRYLYGLNPAHTNIAKDNTKMQLPLENTTTDIPVGEIEEIVWDILDHDFAPEWNSEGFRSSSKTGTITQQDEYVNILKPNESALGSEKLYHWVISPAGMSLPRTGFTLQTTVRLAGGVNGEANEIGVRMGEHSEDLNGKLASVFLGYGEEGYVSNTASASGPYSMTLDTTQWHTLTMVIYSSDNGYCYDLYVDSTLAYDGAPLQTYKGGDLVRFGADNGGRCNMDVKDVRLGSGEILPDGVSPARLTSVALSETTQKETESKTITVSVSGVDFEDGEPATLSLLNKSYTPVDGVAASGSFQNNTAEAELTIPEGLKPGIYYVKAEANGRRIYSAGYEVTSDREAPVFPNFTPAGFTIEMEDYLYNPTQEFNFPSVLDTKDHPVSNELGDYRYYLFYAPHDAPAGCCVAASNSLDGPWVEYGSNPVVSKTWPKEDGSGNYYSVSHVSSPYVMWNDVYDCWFMYFHGENPITRYATSDDLLHWTYGGICVQANDFSPTGSGFNEASYARVFEHEVPGLGNKYIMLLMVTGSGSGGHRNIYWAHSVDGKEWTAVTTSLLDPTMDAEYKGNFSGPYFMEWEGRYFVICHASSGNMYAFEVGEALDSVIPWGIFYNSRDSVTSDAEDESAYPDYGRSGAPSFMQDDDGVWHMFYEGGRRLHANIVHAVETTQAVTEVMAKIDGLGEITLDSKDAIEAARAAYENLPGNQKGFVENYNVLVRAEEVYAVLLERAELEALKEAAEAAQKAAEEALKKAEEAAAAAAVFAARSSAMMQLAIELQKADELTGHSKANYIEIIQTARFALEAAATPAEIETILNEALEALKTSACPSAVFDDVEENTWYHEGIDFCITRGYMVGASKNVFDVNGNLTRAQLVTILHRIAGKPEVENAENPFVDVEDGQWYTDAVIWAANAGVVVGVSDDEFAPDAAITREQIAVILYRYVKAEPAEDDIIADFSDADQVSEFAKEAMNWAVAAGIIRGTQGRLAPQDLATRAQIATIIARYFE